MVEWASFAARAGSHVMAHAEPAVLARAEGKQRAWRQRVAAWEMEDPGDGGLQPEEKKAATWET